MDTADFVALIRQDGVSGTSAPARREDMSKTVTRFIKPIVALLDSEDDDLQTTSALGLAKLLIYDRLVSSQVLSQLLLLWFNPITEDRPAIRRGLACFFTDYACGSPVQAVNTNRNRNSSKLGNFSHQAALAESVLPTLIALIRAPASSPLSEVEPADVAGLLARLTDATHWHQQEQLEKHVTTETQSGAEREDVGEDGEDLDSHTPAVKEADIGRQNPPANRFPEMVNKILFGNYFARQIMFVYVHFVRTAMSFLDTTLSFVFQCRRNRSNHSVSDALFCSYVLV